MLHVDRFYPLLVPCFVVLFSEKGIDFLCLVVYFTTVGQTLSGSLVGVVLDRFRLEI